MNPAEPSTPKEPESEDVMEIGAKAEEVLSTLVTGKGKEKSQGLGKPLKHAKWAEGKPRTSPTNVKTPQAMPQAQVVQEEAQPANPIN